jgi:hypothetical protein
MSSYSLRRRESSSNSMRLSRRKRSFSSDMSTEAQDWGCRMVVLGDDRGDENGDQAWSSPELVGEMDWLPGASEALPDPGCEDFLR